jgi:hypothetical protein
MGPRPIFFFEGDATIIVETSATKQQQNQAKTEMPKDSLFDLKSEIQRKKAERTTGKQSIKKPKPKDIDSIVVKKVKLKTSLVDTLEESKRITQLNKKSKIYDKLSTSKTIDSELYNVLTNDDVMVDFQAKHSSDEVEYEDQFGRLRKRQKTIFENAGNDYKIYSKKDQIGYHQFPPPNQLTIEEKERRELEVEFPVEENVLHYDNSEVREFGVGKFKFSNVESERLRQQEELDRLRQETVLERQKFDVVKNERLKRVQDRFKSKSSSTQHSELDQCKNDEVDEFLNSL